MEDRSLMGGLRPQIQSIVLLSNVALFVASIRRASFPNGPIRVQGAYRHEQGVAVGGSLEGKGEVCGATSLGEEPLLALLERVGEKAEKKDRSHTNRISHQIFRFVGAGPDGLFYRKPHVLPKFQPNAPSRFADSHAVPPRFADRKSSKTIGGRRRSRTRSGEDHRKGLSSIGRLSARELESAPHPLDAAPRAAIESAAR